MHCSYVFLALTHRYMRTSDCSGLIFTGLILGLHPANERRCYIVTMSPIGWMHYAYFPALQLWWLNNTGLLGHFCNWAAGKYSNQWPVWLDSCNRNYCNAQWIFHNWPKLGFHQFDATNIESIPAQVWKLYVLFYFYFFAVVSSIVDVWWTQNKWHQLTILSQTNRTTQKMILVQKEVRHFSNL